jgi:quinoprotein glucose dehydrogenase
MVGPHGQEYTIRDSKFRAFNERKGELLFETELPAPGYATPSAYRVNVRELF